MVLITVLMPFQNQMPFQPQVFHLKHGVKADRNDDMAKEKNCVCRFIHKTLLQSAFSNLRCNHLHGELSRQSSDTVFCSYFDFSAKTSISMHLFCFTHYVISHFQYFKVTAVLFWHAFARMNCLDCCYYRLQFLTKGKVLHRTRILKFLRKNNR